MKLISFLSIVLATAVSLKSLSIHAAVSDRYPSQTNFCTALFTTSSQAISEKQNVEQNRWPIKTLNAAFKFVNEKIIKEALLLPEQRTIREKIFKVRPLSHAIKKIKEVNSSTFSTFDNRHQPISNSSVFLKDSLVVVAHLKSTEVLLEENFQSITLSTTEYRGSNSILRFLDETKDLARQWKNQTDGDLQDIAYRLPTKDRHHFLLRGVTTFYAGLLTAFIADYLMTGQYMFATLFSYILYSDRNLYVHSIRDFQKYSTAFISDKAMDRVFNENEFQSSQKPHQFMEEVALILKQESPWNPSSDFMHLSDGVSVPRELAQSIAYGSSEEFLQKNIVTHAQEEHKSAKTPDHYWHLGYHLSFAYLPKDPSFPDKEIEPTLIVTTYLKKNDNKPPTPKKPKEKKKTAMEESLENNEALAPVRY
jgi:hypothetical protein